MEKGYCSLQKSLDSLFPTVNQKNIFQGQGKSQIPDWLKTISFQFLAVMSPLRTM